MKYVRYFLAAMMPITWYLIAHYLLPDYPDTQGSAAAGQAMVCVFSTILSIVFLLIPEIKNSSK